MNKETALKRINPAFLKGICHRGLHNDRFSENGLKAFENAIKEGVDIKLKALACYTGVMRPYPHPRSDEALRGLAAWRGSQAGCSYAEAFECVFRRI